MTRAIVTPAVLAPAALADLKQWLGITTTRDDVPLTALLRSAIDICEAFTGTMPISCTCEEILPAIGGWQVLTVRPVTAITGVFAVAADNTRTTLAASAYAVELDADGSGRVNIFNAGTARRIAVRFTAGMAATWDVLPDAIRQGIVRLAAHQHREREGSGAAPLPPASVAALWRPWRRMRLA
jgi:uncharacterized phiE125 gp8 family phage protein